MEVGTRQLRYFVAVAEELNFTRAAAKLYIAQQALSSQIRQLEERVGATLLHRTTRKVELTPAGEAFLEEARLVLETVDRAVHRAQRAQRGRSQTLRVGLLLGGALELTAPILNEFRRSHPETHLELIEGRYDDPTMGLAAGLVDVAIVRTPLNVPGLEHEPLFAEPRVFVVARDHPLATQASVTLSDALAQPVVTARCTDPQWNEFWLFYADRHGEPPDVAGEVGSLVEELEMVAAGEACTNIPAGWMRFSGHPGVTFLPFAEPVPPTVCAVAWRVDADPLVRDFVEVATAVRERERELIERIEHPREPLAASS